MSESNIRVPRVGDCVNLPSRSGPFVVQAVYLKPYVVDLRRLKESSDLVLEKGVPWSALVFLDEDPASNGDGRKLR